MYQQIVTIDLETTGTDFLKDEIIEIGAALVQNGEVISTFSRLVKPKKNITPEIIRLTGITPAMVADAPPLANIIAEFLEFLPDDVLCVAHNATFERSFLRRATKDKFKNAVIDTIGLSRVVFPELESHSLGYLCEFAKINNENAHRALSDALVLAQLWQLINNEMMKIPLSVVSEINYLLVPHFGHPYIDYFQRLEAAITTAQFGKEPITLNHLYRENNLQLPPTEDLTTRENWVKLDRQKVEWVFGEDGALAKLSSDNDLVFSARAGQITMAGAVVTAFNNGTHLLVEAGTGTGKSLAYLIPAVLFARENGVPVVISTNTKNLQEQLFEKDITLVKKTLGIDFAAALLKGRSNYLCLRKLFYLLKHADVELDLDDRMQLLTLLNWSIKTNSGDISENIIFTRPGFTRLWIKLRSQGEDCLGRKCQQYRRCFLRKARNAAMHAQIIVANHSLVFAELNNTRTPSLPPFAQLVFDEAHNLEDAATAHLSIEITPLLLETVSGRLLRYGRKKVRTGLLASIYEKIQSAHEIPAALAQQAITHCSHLIDLAAMITTEGEVFFARVENIRTQHPDKPPTLRFSPDRQRSDLWQPARDAQKNLIGAIGETLSALNIFVEDCKQIEESALAGREEIVRDLTAAAAVLRQFSDDLTFTMSAENEEYVYWLEKISHRENDVALKAAPISIGRLLLERLYANKRSIIFCSATMTVNNKFDFLKNRLGLSLLPVEKLQELNAGTPFNYRQQCRIFAPTFLPEPGEKGGSYTNELEKLLVDVFRQTHGRALALFTSYEMLSHVFHGLAKDMVNDGIKILAQGQSGSRKNITAIFQRDIHSVLLGTHSFWEGVDVVGESLSCLIIARLPFAPVGEPLNEARCEYIEKNGGNAFMQYSLPNAVIKFRQGFGRLIRHHNDKGVVIVADRRIISKRYGINFQNSVPCPTQEITERKIFLQQVKEFLSEA